MRAVLAGHIAREQVIIARLWKYRPRHRPSRNSSVCWPFSLVMALAGDTGDIFLSLGESVLYMYPCAGTTPRCTWSATTSTPCLEEGGAASASTCLKKSWTHPW